MTIAFDGISTRGFCLLPDEGGQHLFVGAVYIRAGKGTCTIHVLHCAEQRLYSRCSKEVSIMPYRPLCNACRRHGAWAREGES